MKNCLKELRSLLTGIYIPLSNIIGYLLLLTGFFVLIELAFFILCNDSYLSIFKFVSDRIHLPASILPGIFFYIFAQLLLHFSFCFMAALIAAILIYCFNIRKSNQLTFSIVVLLVGMLSVMLANSYYYPNSRFAQLVFLNHKIVDANNQPLAHNSSATYQSAATPDRPNIIIVGIDSLRPTILDFFGGDVTTPFIDDYLKSATVFSEAITPLARTYPSWVSILTGEYPMQNGVRTNLSGSSPAVLSQTIPSLLREQGYETAYAIDETRFSNIDTRFGFDNTINAPVGVNDFLLGTFNDFPLSNLVVNTMLGKWLFPYSYANRAAYITYNPNSFIEKLKPSLLRDHAKPLFFAVHFCLPHHPYLYSDLSGDYLTGQQRYLYSIKRADQQVRDFFAVLQQAGLLKHAVVVLLSDHGEALEFPGDRITERDAYASRGAPPEYYPASEDKLAMNQSAGHGTDVLGLPQYHSLLAFKLYGLGKQQERVVPGVVSLLDIKPTVLALVKAYHPAPNEIRCSALVEACHPTHASGAGSSALTLSLLPQILGVSQPPARMLFLESDYSPDALRSVHPETRKLLLEGADLFQIDPTTTRVSVKPEMVTMIIKSKQLAVIYENWMLALYPQASHARMPVLVNLKTGQWTTNLTSSFARQSPADQMHIALRQFYGQEVR